MTQPSQLTLRGSVFISTLPYVRSLKSLVQAMTPCTHSPDELEYKLYMTIETHLENGLK
jgi:hypothetical protein